MSSKTWQVLIWGTTAMVSVALLTDAARDIWGSL